ncbi:MAG: hypothetical protein IKR57_06230 [Bacilli bacterium]|nr:hypothetical protein [Bacilli bacterium]
MTLISFFTSLINIGTEWYMTAIYAVCLFFEGIVFEGVTLIYNLFLLVCTINLSTVSGLLSSLIERVKALIIVFIVFKLGVALIGYLLEPDKAQKEGTKIVVNIFITAVLLISYSMIFDIFNELNLLILGNPTNYPYTVLSTIVDVSPEEKDKGLIMRLVFGDKADDLDDVGEYLSYSTLTMFIYDYGNPSSSNNVSAIICPATSSNGCDFKKLVNANSKINLTIEYHPVFAFIVGLFLIYSIGKSTISVGVRMFKLVILQLLAPLAIVTILDGGIKADIFQKYIKKYIEVYLSAMLRLLATLIITVFLCKFIVNVGDYAALNDTGNTWMNMLLAVIVIWAGFKFLSEAPAFIESIIGMKLGGDDKTSFGQFLGGVIGGAVGGIAGLSTGTLAGTISGFAGGISSGAKGKSVAEWFKNQSANSANAKNVGANARMAGGSLAYGASKVGGFLGIPQNKLEKGKLAGERQTAMDNMVKALEENYDEQIVIGGQKVGVDRGIFNNYAYKKGHDFYKGLSEKTRGAVDKTNDAYEAYTAAQGEYDKLRSNPSATDAQLKKAFEKVEASRTAFQSLKASTDKKVDTDFNTRMLENAKKGKYIKSKGKLAVKTAIETYDNVASAGYTTDDFVAGTKHLVNGEWVAATTKTASDHYTKQQDRTTHSRSATRYTNSNLRGGGGK